MELNIKFYASMVRVYFNRDVDPSKAWSIDFGPRTPEILCGEVFLQGVQGNSCFRPDAGDNVTEPRAWLVFGYVNVERRGPQIILSAAKDPVAEEMKVYEASRSD